MPRIISVSRRSDIPAYYGQWFINRLKDGFAGYVNPFGGQKYIVSLRSEDVACFVFWSKNFAPFMDKLPIIEEMGYRFYFNNTITELPEVFENGSVRKETGISALKELSCSYSPAHINWRYDPIIISDATDNDFHIRNFESLAASLEGYVERCIISFVMMYGKVKRSFVKFQSDHGIKIIDPDIDSRIRLANQLADIAKDHGIKMLSCCGDILPGEKIGKAHCVDGKLIEELFHKGSGSREKPTRKECGCTESVDIGAYDTCPHGCVYCYANMNKRAAQARFNCHETDAAFLGYGKEESDRWVEELKNKVNREGSSPTLFDYI